MKVVVFENRKSDIVGVKLLVLSLLRHCPGLELEVTFPAAPPGLERWFDQHPGARLRTDWSPDPRRGYWNVKPFALLRALDEGEPRPIWIDSDVIFAGDFRPLLAGLADETMVVAEEYFGAPAQGGTLRTERWDLPVGRSLPNTTNSGFASLTEAHRGLLESWTELLLRPDYQAGQKLDSSQRARHMVGDQDALTALLGSQRFADVPIRWIRRGTQMAQCFEHGGYPMHERLRNLVTRHDPPIIHTLGEKPWRPYDGPSLHTELSPYTLEAVRYASELDGELDWCRPTLRGARLLRKLFNGHPTAAGLLPAIGRELTDQRIVKVWVKKRLGWL